METPLYMTVKNAARYVGIGERAMWDCVHSKNPPPYMMVGNKYMLQVAALPAYFEAKQEARMR